MFEESPHSDDNGSKKVSWDETECVGTEKTFGISTFIGKGEAKDEEVGEVTEKPGKAGDTGSMDEREEGAK